MQIRKAQRKFRWLKIGLGGVSGSGKTYGALKMAHGITGDWNKICVVDTENNSADLYSDFGPYDVLPIATPYTPTKYIEAIETIIKGGRHNVIIIDSLSHEWIGQGGIIDLVDQYAKSSKANSFTAWGNVNPIHQRFVDSWIQCPCHIIATLRSKDDYAMEKDEKSGKTVVKKIGLKNIQRDQLDFEFDILMRVDTNHNTYIEKTRANIFSDEFFRLDESVGEKLIKWAQGGQDLTSDYKIAFNNASLIKDDEKKQACIKFLEENKDNPQGLKKALQRINQLIK